MYLQMDLLVNLMLIGCFAYHLFVAFFEKKKSLMGIDFFDAHVSPSYM